MGGIRRAHLLKRKIEIFGNIGYRRDRDIPWTH